MNRFVFLIIFVFIYSNITVAQQSTSDYYENILMLKLKPEYKYLATKNTIDNVDFQDFISKLQSYKLSKAFPKHTSPRETFNQYGDSLVDLSLWYVLNYQSNVPPAKLIQQIKHTGVFQFVERRSINHLLWIPNDPKIGKQFYLDVIHAYEAWDIEKGDTNIVVGVTDTGIDKAHEDLVDGIKYNYEDTLDGIDNDNDGFIDNFCGWDVGNNDNNAQFGLIGHGTFVSGFISAVPNNNIGIAGVGYNIKTLPVKIDDTLGYLAKDYEGIVYAADHGVFAINCSWGGTHGDNYGREIVNYATNNAGCLVVAACGNSNNNVFLYPASYENVFSCAATDSNDVRWEFSSYGSQVDISAPGTFVFSTWTYNSYISSHGTSFSSPIVAAVAALVKSHYPQLTNRQVAEKLRVTADVIDTIPDNQSTAGLMGSGRVNAYQALIDSMKPSIRLKNKTISYKGDTIEIVGDFMNYLHASSNFMKAIITINSPYLLTQNTIFHIGALNTLTSINNASQPLSLKVLPGAPIGYYTDVKINFIDTNYSAFQYVRVYVKDDNAILDTNKITTSVNSRSTIGFTTEDRMVGSGFTYKQGKNILYLAGLVVGTASNRVSDNIYGLGGYDKDFRPLNSAQKINPAIDGDLMWFNTYNDDSMGVNKNNIEVEQYSFAFNNSKLENVIFINYKIKNTANISLDNVYAGIYADWDIDRSYANKARYDSLLKLTYIYPNYGIGGTHAGIQFLNDSAANCYNFDNNGFNGSINLYDGFPDFEKWDALTTSRHIAGEEHTYGGDVSSLLSSGPYQINSGESLNLLFAFIAGEGEYVIKTAAQNAIDWYFNTAGVHGTSIIDNLKLNISPNPFVNTTNISFFLAKSSNINIEILDANGRIIKVLDKGRLSSGKHTLKLDLNNQKSGLYYYRLTTDELSITKKLILNK